MNEPMRHVPNVSEERTVTISRKGLRTLTRALEDQIESSNRWRASAEHWYRNWKLTFGALLVAVIAAVVGWLR